MRERLRSGRSTLTNKEPGWTGFPRPASVRFPLRPGASRRRRVTMRP